MKTSTAGTTPRPSESRQTARRWSLPKLDIASVECLHVDNDRVRMKDAHPEKDKGDEGADDETPVDHGV